MERNSTVEDLPSEEFFSARDLSEVTDITTHPTSSVEKNEKKRKFTLFNSAIQYKQEHIKRLKKNAPLIFVSKQSSKGEEQ